MLYVLYDTNGNSVKKVFPETYDCAKIFMAEKINIHIRSINNR